MAAMDPVKVIDASPEPVPLVNVSPAVPLSDTTPLAAASVTSTGLLPASASDTEMAFAPDNTSAPSSSTLWDPGTALTGAAFGGTAAAGSPVTLRLYGHVRRATPDSTR